MFDLLEQDNSRQIAQLRTRHNHNVAESNRRYHQEFAAVQKRYLAELIGFLEVLTNKSTQSKVDKVFAANPRPKSPNSSFSSESSNSQFLATSTNSTSSIEDDAPDWILDPISFSILKDPVVTPCGITYERAPLMDYLQNHGNRDPITRKPLHTNDLVPNLAIKEVVAEYLREHEIV